MLVASLNRVNDNDGLDKANGADNVLGAVNSDWRVATTSAGVVLTSDDLDDSMVAYQWKEVVGKKDDDPNKPANDGADIDLSSANGAQGPSYTVQNVDVGKTIYVVATIADDADSDQAGPITKDNESIISAGVDVKRVVTFLGGSRARVVSENGTTNVELLVSPGANALTVHLVTDPATGDLVDNRVPASVTIGAATTDTIKSIAYNAPADVSGTQSFTISIVTTGDNALPANHVVGFAGSITIRVVDGMNNPPPTTTSLTIDNTSPVAGDTLTATLSGLTDADGLNDPHPVTFTWSVAGTPKKTETVDAMASSPLSATSTYVVAADDEGKSIAVSVEYTDNAGRTNTIAGEKATDKAVLPVTAPPDGTAKISKIAPAYRGIVASEGDKVRLSVNVYGLQNVKDAKLGNDVTFNWSVSPAAGGALPADEKGNSTVVFTGSVTRGLHRYCESLVERLLQLWCRRW